MLLSKEDVILEILEEKVCLDSRVAVSAGIIGVILAAARSSTFLATAKVSTLLKENVKKSKKKNSKLFNVS